MDKTQLGIVSDTIERGARVFWYYICLFAGKNKIYRIQYSDVKDFVKVMQVFYVQKIFWDHILLKIKKTPERPCQTGNSRSYQRAREGQLLVRISHQYQWIGKIFCKILKKNMTTSTQAPTKKKPRNDIQTSYKIIFTTIE